MKAQGSTTISRRSSSTLNGSFTEPIAPNGPVFFSSSGLGRFDILGVAGLGTCYTSPSPIEAYLVTLGRLGTVSVGVFDQLA